MPYPRDCPTCPVDERLEWGCGFAGFAGMADPAGQGTYSKGARSSPWNRTCPQYCLRLPEVDAVLCDVEDYKRGALGNVDDLDAARLAYLRVAELEMEACRAQQERALIDG